jgi:hypothetical protein
MNPGQSNTRRWPRQQVDLPVSVVMLSGVSRIVIPGRATEISEGGMALYAGMIHPRRGDLVEVEFQIPSHARVAAIIRNRSCFSFGVEFLTPVLTDAGENTVAQLAAFALRKGRHAELEPEVSASEDAASAYAMLAKVLRLEGQEQEAELADQAVMLFARLRDVCLHEKALSSNSLQRQFETMHRAARMLLQRYFGEPGTI